MRKGIHPSKSPKMSRLFVSTSGSRPFTVRAMKGRVTDEAASTLPKNEVLWDNLDPGFGVRRQREIAVFIVRYRQNGIRRHITLGREPELTAAEARSKAKVILDAARKQEPPEIPWEIS